jgi:hypothetical protein
LRLGGIEIDRLSGAPVMSTPLARYCVKRRMP